MAELNSKQVLKNYWSYDSFRSPQEEIVEKLVKKEELIGLLPTGAGKSICFQVPGLILEGLTLVISPLVALMEDQVSALTSRNIKAIFLHGGMRKRELDIQLDNAIYGDYKFLYLSPERIHSEIFTARVAKMNLSQIIIDEAHCISQWGHDFRPSYKQLIGLRDLFPGVPISAFTATATKQTLEDMKLSLGYGSVEVFRKSFAKENLSYTVINSTNKQRELLYILARVKGAGIIYQRSRRASEQLAEDLRRNGFEAQYYHAGLDYKERKNRQNKWLNGSDEIMVATNAFGMGIDKSDVRWVIHMDIPSSLEEYYQEAGRAGRDGEKSYAILIYDEKDEENAYTNLQLSQVDSIAINSTYDKICRFLNIGIDEGIYETFDFDVNLFSKKYKIPIMKVLAVVRTLEEAGILSTTESVYSPSTLFLNRASEETFRNRDSESEFAKFLLSLVRNYEGLFSHQVKISEEKISRFSGLEIEKVFKFLKNLTELGYGEYSPRSELPRILFLCNRVEAKSLSIDYVKIEQLFKWKWSKLETMISFVNSDSCRESKILNYFSEKTSKKCGRCDICKGSSKDSFKVSELDDLYSYLKSKNLKRIDLYDVLHWWPHNKRRKVLAMLSILENENRISIKNKSLELV